MIGLVATIKVQEGKSAEFEQIFRDLTAKVKANEPGCLMYQLTKSRTEPDTYKVLELYRDQDALSTHGGSEYFKAASRQMGACMDGRANLDYLDAVE